MKPEEKIVAVKPEKEDDKIIKAEDEKGGGKKENIFRSYRGGSFGKRWTKDEHDEFIKLIKEHGKDYCKISEKMNKTKTADQCMRRVQHLFIRWKAGELVIQDQ